MTAPVSSFAGFVPARSAESWRAQEEDRRWRVEAQPNSVHVELPPEWAATETVGRWVNDLVACDGNAAGRLQAASALYGPSDLVGLPCREKGAWLAGAPLTLDRAPDVQPLLEAFGPDTGTWARLVPLSGPGRHFFAEVAPLGDDWRVIGVTADGGGGP